MIRMIKNFRQEKIKAELNPFFYACDSITQASFKYFILFLIQFAVLIAAKSLDSALVITTSFLGGLLAAAAYFVMTREDFYQNYEMVIQGIIIGFFLPSSFPLISVFLTSFVTLFLYKVLVRHSNNWITPAAVAIVICWFIGKSYFPDFFVSADLIASKNPSASLITQGAFPVYGFDSTITNLLNAYVLSPFRVSIPEGLISLLWDTNSTIPAFRFNILNLLSAIVLFCGDDLLELIPTVFVLTYVLLVRFFAPLAYGGNFNSGDVLLALFSGGTLFTAAFFLQFPGTIPITKKGKVIFGLCAGLLAFLICGTGTSPVGMAYTVLICNLLNLPLRYFEDAHTERTLRRKIFSL